MARNVAFVKNEAGFRSLLNSGRVQTMCLTKAQAKASQAQGRATYKNARYTADVQAGTNRCHARASTASEGAWWNEMRHGKGSGPLAQSL